MPKLGLKQNWAKRRSRPLLGLRDGLLILVLGRGNSQVASSQWPHFRTSKPRKGTGALWQFFSLFLALGTHLEVRLSVGTFSSVSY